MLSKPSIPRRLALAIVLAAMLGGVTAFLPTPGAIAQTPAGGEWRVISIAGFDGEIVADVHLAFDANGNFGGFGGCNRLIGRYALSAGAISLDGVARTRMKCPPPRMSVENALVAAMETPDAAGVIADGRLTFIADGKPLIVLER